MFVLYNVIYIIFAICYLPFFLLRGKCHRGVLMRLGIFPQRAIDKLKDKSVIWLHTVSVGEIQAASALVRNLKQRYAGLRLVISTVTETGNRIARKLAGPDDLVIYLPLDIGFIVSKVIRLIKPRLFIVAETEIWPNLIINLAKKGIPVALVNGRLSRGSFRGYKIIRPFFKKVLQKVNLFCMQTEQDAKRIIRLGADAARVKVTGNMKFDIEQPQTRVGKADFGLSEEEKLFIAGSTHPGEEDIILQVYKELIGRHPKLRLLIAPRHVERTKEIEGLVARFGFKSQKISSINSTANFQPPTANSILILDTIGQLKGLYELADIVFIGGSLISHGGQNPIEPAVFARAIIFGPHMSNFSNIVESFLAKGAAIMVKDAGELKKNCSRLLDNPGLQKEIGRRAQELVRQNTGATLKNLELIMKEVSDGG